MKKVSSLSSLLVFVSANVYGAYPTTFWQAEQNGEVYELNYGDGTTNTTSFKIFDTDKVGAAQYCDKDGNNCITSASMAAGGKL